MSRKEYLKYWRERNREKLRKYNREYMRKKRGGLKKTYPCKLCGVSHRIKNFHKVIHTK